MPLTSDEINAALEKVSVIFPSAPASTALEGKASGADQDARRNVPRSGRARVDSTARPPEFARNIKEPQPKTPVNYHEFSVHGVHEPVLRQRLESKAIDVETLNRVQIEFKTHDKLSQEELSKLSVLAEQAHQLHRERDINGAEKLYEQASCIMFFSLWNTID